jgi:Zn-dependent membrane protease YugP
MNLLWIDYLTIALPGILLTIWARVRIVRANAAGARINASSELSGAETAALVMEAAGVPRVEIVPASGELSNHYDAARRVLRLSRDVFEGRSLTAVGVAAHEAGHAIQDSAGYPGLIVRNATVPWTVLGSQVCWLFLAAGLWLGMMRLIVLAIGLFWLLLLIQLANVPVELDASRRAREILGSSGLVTDEEVERVARVSNAAAWTYVAAVLWGHKVRVGWVKPTNKRLHTGGFHPPYED